MAVLYEPIVSDSLKSSAEKRFVLNMNLNLIQRCVPHPHPPRSVRVTIIGPLCRLRITDKAGMSTGSGGSPSLLYSSLRATSYFLVPQLAYIVVCRWSALYGQMALSHSGRASLHVILTQAACTTP